MPDPISTALTAWAARRLADTAADAVRRRRLRDVAAPEVRRALVTVVRTGVDQSLRTAFPDDADRGEQVRRLLLERGRDQWPLLDGTYPCDLPGAVREWVSWIESPPDELGRTAPVQADHPFVLQLCTAILEGLRHDATRGSRVLTELWLDFRTETGIAAGGTEPLSQPSAPPAELCFQPRYWTDRTEIIERILRLLRAPDRCPVVLSGPVGSGKTTLAGVAAALLKDHFSGGVLHLEPRPGRAVDEMYSALERIGWSHLPSAATEVERRYRSALGSRNMIVVLDEPGEQSDVERFWPRSDNTAYIVLTSKPIRWRVAETIALPPLSTDDSTALVESVESLAPDEVKNLIDRFGCLPGRLLDAAGIVGARSVGADELAALATRHDDLDLFLHTFNSVSPAAQRLYRTLSGLPDPVLEQSLLDQLDTRSGGDAPSRELQRARLMVETGPALWRLRLKPGKSSNGADHV